MSESALTPHTAPRNLAGLLKETPFKLRLLAQTLGGLTSEEQKLAWHQMQTSEARAELILALLKGWDAANPGAAHPVTNGATPHTAAQPQQQFQPQQPPQQQFAATPPQQQFQQQPQFQAPTQQQLPIQNIAPVGPAQVSPQTAAAATAATGAPSGRKPRNAGAAASAPTVDADVATQVLGMLNTILGGLGSDAERFQKLEAKLTSILEEASSSKGSRVTALEAKYGEVSNSLQHLSAAVQSQSQAQLWTLMAFLTFMQEQMGVSMTDILGAAISDSAMFQQLVDKATGKA